MKEKTITVFTRLQNQREKIINTYNSLSENQLQFNPGPNDWNLLQVMQHLIIAEKQSLLYIQRKIARHEDVPKAGFGSVFRHTLLKIALMLPIKFKAPKIAEVKEEYPNFEEMKSEWDSIRNEMEHLIKNNDGTILAKALYKQPRAGLLNIKQALEFFEIHIAHHLKQIKRIKNHPSFPD
ncbi:MAG: DinB family protein [Balneolaceae bacterium]